MATKDESTQAGKDPMVPGGDITTSGDNSTTPDIAVNSSTSMEVNIQERISSDKKPATPQKNVQKSSSSGPLVQGLSRLHRESVGTTAPGEDPTAPDIAVNPNISMEVNIPEIISSDKKPATPQKNVQKSSSSLPLVRGLSQLLTDSVSRTAPGEDPTAPDIAVNPSTILKTITPDKKPAPETATSPKNVESSSSVPLVQGRSRIPKDSGNLKEFLLRSRKAMAGSEQEPGKVFVKNDYEKAEACGNLIRKKTGVVYDNKMELHECPWDLNYAENPKRYRVVLERCRQLKLLERCVQLPYVCASREQITTLHSTRLYEKLDEICSKSNLEEVEHHASEYDSIYFNKETFHAAKIASGCAISLVKAVCDGTVQNGMAIIRPPGHHAMKEEYCGYCYFNNVAIAAKYALDNQLAKKILIVDVDVHHGQATQRMFYNDNRVLYFSIHRYEHGLFWPNLRESNYDYIGEDAGKGFNINCPLNAIGLEDSDYLSFVTHILLPIAYEFQPDLIIVSAGFDAAIGDDKGEMEVSPGFYGHLIMLLSGLAHGKIAVCLEGGYFLPSLAEGAAMTLKALLGDPLATLQPLEYPHFTVVETINNLKIALHDFWNCFRVFELHETKPDDDSYTAVIKYLGEPPDPPYPTRNCYPTHSAEFVKKLIELVSELQREYQRLGTNQLVACCYDECMLLHASKNRTHVEMPARLSAIYELYKEWGLDTRCINVEPLKVDLYTIKQVHSDEYVTQIIRRKLRSLIKNNQTDMYYNDGTVTAIFKAIDCLVGVADNVINGLTQSGVALIRPPGHHADAETPAGFCYLNNVAVATKYLIENYELSRVLIVDFDIHHGNGTQNIFYQSDKVLYMSVHRFDPERFFPKSEEGSCDHCGEGPGKGFNVNIGLSSEKLYDVDYITIFHRIILPIAYSFAPEIVIVSAGFDAGINDTLGHYAVTPECFGHFIQLLKPLANGKIILALEGGYNTTTVKYAMNICIKTLLGDPLPPLDFQPGTVNPACHTIINKVIRIQQQYWPVLKIGKKLSASKPILIVSPGYENCPPCLQLRKIGRFFKKLTEYEKESQMDSESTTLPQQIKELDVSGAPNVKDQVPPS